MRRRLAIPLILLVGAAPWIGLLMETPPPDQPAVLASVLGFPNDADWMGGVSGIEVAPDGKEFFIITDRGHLARGTLERDADTLQSLTFDGVRRLVEDDGVARPVPIDDAEGLAIDATGRIFVSFEHVHRVLQYDSWDARAKVPAYTQAWRALANNKGLEALAVTESGALLTLPEQVNLGASEALLYTLEKDGDWRQNTTLPVRGPFEPVGADVGPGGNLYLLERQFSYLGFRSRVRVLSQNPGGFAQSRTILQTAWGDHGNLEGIAVWRDTQGRTRLTMVSDDNFLPVLRGQMVEYIVDEGVARAPN